MDLNKFSKIGVNALYESVALNGIKKVGLDNIIDQLNEINNAGDAGMLKRFPQFYAKIKQIINSCEFAKNENMVTENYIVDIVKQIVNLREIAYQFFC